MATYLRRRLALPLRRALSWQGSFDSTGPFAGEWAGSAQDDIAIDCSERMVMTLLLFSETSIDIQIDDDVV
jgi:hypothetical protein